MSKVSSKEQASSRLAKPGASKTLNAKPEPRTARAKQEKGYMKPRGGSHQPRHEADKKDHSKRDNSKLKVKKNDSKAKGHKKK